MLQAGMLNNLSAVTPKHSEQTIISSACSELLSPVTTGHLGPSPLVFTDIWHPDSSWLSCPVCFDNKHATEGMSRGGKNMTTNTPTSCGAVCDDASQHQTKTLWWAFLQPSP